MQTLNKEELIQILEKSFVKENAKGMNTSIQMNLSGEGGGEWFMLIKDQALTIQNGVYEDARATVDVETENLVKIISGELDPLKAFFTGKVQISGDQGVIMKMLSIFQLTGEDLKKIKGE